MAGDSLPAFLIEKLREELGRYRERGFLKAVLAASALCSLADGEISIEERYQIDNILAGDLALSRFDGAKAAAIFDDYARALREDPLRARDVLMQKVERLGDHDPKQARTAMRAAWLVVTANDVVTPAEDAMFYQLCTAVGLDPDVVRLGVETAW